MSKKSTDFYAQPICFFTTLKHTLTLFLVASSYQWQPPPHLRLIKPSTTPLSYHWVNLVITQQLSLIPHTLISDITPLSLLISYLAIGNLHEIIMASV